MTSSTEERMAEIRAREQAASAGPWVFDNNDGYGSSDIWSKMTPTGSGRPGRFVATAIGDDAQAEDDADFIAHARQDVPWLLEQLVERDELIALLRNKLCPPTQGDDGCGGHS